MAKKTKPSAANHSVIELDQELPELPNRQPWQIPTEYLEKDGKGSFKVVSGRRPSKTLLVNKIRTEVDLWRKNNYAIPSGISKTSLRLLENWFDDEHIVFNEDIKANESFKFRFGLREAIETIIYLYEIKKCKDSADLVLNYMDDNAYGNDLFVDKKAILETAKNKRILKRIVPETGLQASQEIPPEGIIRYCCKAATGSGKTWIMIFLTVWSYFHKKYEPNSELSKTILIIAPNVIVFERLKTDFENGIIFKKFPFFIPNEWRHDWQMSFIMREDQVRSSTDGTLYLTNIHQIYESRENNSDDDFDKPVSKLLGSQPKKDSTASWLSSIYERIKEHDELLVINDEAHHVHDEDLAWYKSILSLHNNLITKGKSGLSMILDFTATPKDQNGTFFPWIISDYPLAQAVEDKIVKTPLIVHQTDKTAPDAQKVKNAYHDYYDWIKIAIERYREHEKSYGKLGQKPVLFIMTESTTDADNVAEEIKKLGDFNKKDQVLLIHTNKDGSLPKDANKLEDLREDARKIDDKKSKVKVVVSVMMLKEGWDVRNVSIVLGLRPFSAKSNILPEQAVGRGLRLMQSIGPNYTQILEIIGTDEFEKVVKDLNKEGVGVGVTTKTPSLGIYIYPVKSREKYNIEIPVLSSSFTRKIDGLATFDAKKIPAIGELDQKGNIKDIKVTLEQAIVEKKVGTKQIVIEDDDAPSSQELLSDITNKIIKEGKFTGKFNQVFSILKRYVQQYCFSAPVDIDSLLVRKNLRKTDIKIRIIQVIARSLGEHIRTNVETKVVNYPISLFELDGFYWKRDKAECKKTVFNYTPVYNELEKAFAMFLEKATDITKFAALAESYTKFSITYLNKKGAQSLYYPDFIAEQIDGKSSIMWIIETKGQEFEDVKYKDDAAHHWCMEATKHTKVEWKFLKVSDVFFRNKKNNFNSFKEMLVKYEIYNADSKRNMFTS